VEPLQSYDISAGSHRHSPSHRGRPGGDRRGRRGGRGVGGRTPPWRAPRPPHRVL